MVGPDIEIEVSIPRYRSLVSGNLEFHDLSGFHIIVCNMCFQVRWKFLSASKILEKNHALRLR